MTRKNSKKSEHKKNTTDTVKVLEEKTKSLSITNEIETLPDSEQDKQAEHINPDPENNNQLNQNLKMKSSNRKGDKNRDSNKKKTKNTNGKSSKKQDFSTGKPGNFKDDRSKSGNRQENLQSLKHPETHKDLKRDRSRSESRQEYASSSKDSNYPMEHNPRPNRSTSRNRQDSGCSSKSDFQQKQSHKQVKSKSGNREDSGISQDRNKSPKRERSRSGNRHSSQNSHRKSQNKTPDNWYDLDTQQSHESQDKSWDNNFKTHKQSYKSQDNWLTKQSQVNKKSSNLNDPQLIKSNKQKDINVGKLFDQYEKEFLTTKKIQYNCVEETFGDLFEVPEDYSLGHCVAEDMGMGSGIAVQFRQKFKQVEDLLDQRQKQGGLAVLKDKTRFIYYLVTKQVSNGKPTYQSLFKSLLKMKQHIIDNNVNQLALPRIGCGLDRLEWDNVKFMLEFLFGDVNIKILILNYQQDDESTTTPLRLHNCKVVHERYAIDAIDSGTLIIYLSSEDGEVTEEMENLDKKFHFLHKFKTTVKRSGDVIYFDANNYGLYGCIVKKTKNDLISFNNLFKCICRISRENRKLEFNYVGFQAIDNKDDEIINNKIINILRNTLWKVDVYICYPVTLYNLMPPPPRDRFNVSM